MNWWKNYTSKHIPIQEYKDNDIIKVWIVEEKYKLGVKESIKLRNLMKELYDVGNHKRDHKKLIGPLFYGTSFVDYLFFA